MSTQTTGREMGPDELVAELRGLVAEAERMLGESGQASPEKVSALCERFEAVRGRVTALYASARDRVIGGAKSTDAAIRDHPYAALAIALGVGVLLGAVVARRPEQ
ncbi:MAG: DUF883 domain-containing protein [Opitutaceae bacterium]|nr:DUF883 domain-containing protein [Opitutaceae bacterium]